MNTQINSSILAALIGVALTTQAHAQNDIIAQQVHFTDAGEPLTGTAEFQFTFGDAEL